MQRLRTLLHSSSALFAFEAAARHLSFTRAAEELNVSQPAVSQIIKDLESRLGVALFHRKHRKITLTNAGSRFYYEVSNGLSIISRGAEALQSETSSRHVSLSMSTAFANYWLLPKLGEVKAEFPEIEIRVQTTDRDIDIGIEGIPIGIQRCLEGSLPGYRSFLLADEEIVPVASPDYLAGRAPICRPLDLLGHTLLHLEEPFRPRPTWSDWFRHADISFADTGAGLRLNDYALVVQAALAGQGVGLGWWHIVQGLIERGQLRQLTDTRLKTSFGFRVIWPNSHPLSPAASVVVDWLRSKAHPCGERERSEVP